MNKLVALVLAACVALAAGQKDKIELPAPLDDNDYDVPAVEKTTCNYLPTVFETAWSSDHATTGCNTTAMHDGRWVAAKGAVTPGAWFSTEFAAAGTLAACYEEAYKKVTGDGLQADCVKICKYVDDIVNACACARLQCVTEKVNAAVQTANANTCNHFAAGACVHYKDFVDTTCDDAFDAKPTFGGTPARTATFNNRPSAFPPTCGYACDTAGTTTPAPSTPSGAAGVSSFAGVLIAAAAAALGASLL